jgi:hypothetical protein
MLAKNVEAENLEEGESLLWTYENEHLTRKDEPGAMLRYNVHRVLGWDAFLHGHGTFLAERGLWLTCSVYWAFTGLLAAILYMGGASHVEGRHSVTGAPLSMVNDTSLKALTTVAGYSTTLLGFMLSLFVSNIISRWWKMRESCVGGLWTATTDIMLHFSIRLTDPADDEFKERILRLCLLSHRLVYMEAGEFGRADGSADRPVGAETLDQLIAVGLLSPQEKTALQGRYRMGEIVWVWINRLGREKLLELIAEKRITGNHVVEMKPFDSCCAKAKNAIGEVFVYTSTQLPFQYVHLLAFTVIVSNLLLSIKCGVAIGKGLRPDSPVEYVNPLVEAFQVFFVPFSYHAFLRLCDDLSNPFGEKLFGSNFPGFSYHCKMRSECLGILEAGKDLPKGM